ncbi:hypothetical protein EDD85DRAFT_1026601 [Armillaria nabsnona]|nr:hypothetical protein EDD85DRAFT_1026601 [Armillaria nabsnona]
MAELQDELESGCAEYVHLCSAEQSCLANIHDYQDSGDDTDVDDEYNNNMKTAWMDHTSFFVELLSVASLLRGAMVLLDPVFDEQCSPSYFPGQKRFNDPLRKIEDMPYTDAVVISTTMLFKQAYAVHSFTPLGNEKHF